MGKHSTLIYLVNSFQSDFKINNLIETSINSTPKKMSKAEHLPSDRIIDNILNFSRSYEVYKTEKAGYVELNLN